MDKQHLYPRRRTKSSTFYPSTLKSIYQTAQNMSNTHLTRTCQYIPAPIREELIRLAQNKKTSAGGGKEFWADGCRMLGVYETDDAILRFHPQSTTAGAAAAGAVTTAVTAASIANRSAASSSGSATTSGQPGGKAKRRKRDANT